jgi:N-acetylmuramoyl-L-alanine amidase
MAYTIVIDPGHGGSDWGAVYEGRKEKDDNLNLALAVGKILENNGIDVEYTRTDDVYNTPLEKAMMGNNAGADFFISFHRNATGTTAKSTGVETLVFDDSGVKAEMARNINRELANLGFQNRGVIERPNLVVLKRTNMPALLIETGFIDNEEDNAKFDAEFDEIAEAIAQGILETLDMEGLAEKPLYKVQTGAYEDKGEADQMVTSLKSKGFEPYIIFQNGLYKVQVGAYEKLSNAVAMDNRLRDAGYATFITT